MFHIEAGRVGFVYHDVVRSSWFKVRNGAWERVEFAKRCPKNTPMLVMVESSQSCRKDPFSSFSIEILVISQIAHPNTYWEIPEEALKPYTPGTNYV